MLGKFLIFNFKFLIILLVTYCFLLAPPAQAAPEAPSFDEPAGPKQIEYIFSRVVSLSVGLIFVALVFVLIWAGIKYLTSGGEAKAVQSAALTVTWAGLGILFLAIAWLILLLIQSFTGVNVTIFCVDIKGCL